MGILTLPFVKLIQLCKEGRMMETGQIFRLMRIILGLGRAVAQHQQGDFSLSIRQWLRQYVKLRPLDDYGDQSLA